MVEALKRDDFFYYIEQANFYLDNIVEIDEFSTIFEAEDPETAKKIEDNEENKKKSDNFLIKAFEAIKRGLRRIKDAITNFFFKGKLDEAERQAYEEWAAACKKDPKLRNMKINVKTYQNIKAEYVQLMKECEKEDREIAEGKRTECDALIGKLKNFVKRIGATVGVSVGIESVKRMAASNREFASLVTTFVDKDSETMDKISDLIGKRNANRDLKDVKAMSKGLSLRAILLRHKMNANDALSDSLMGTVKKTLSDMLHFKNMGGVTRDLLGSKEVRSTVTAPIEGGARAAVGNLKGRHAAKKTLRASSGYEEDGLVNKINEKLTGVNPGKKMSIISKKKDSE